MSTGERFQRVERYQQRRKTPSFSSSLLDAIYRSIDESNGEAEEGAAELVICRETTTATVMKKQSNASFKRQNASEDEEEIASLRRAIMIEKWMENQSDNNRNSRLYNSTSSSSESSCGGAFSCSETESTNRGRNRSSIFTMQRPKQVRTGVSARSERCDKSTQSEQTPKREARFMRTNLKALKIYNDLKKVKQPISPGGRITNFLNSLFNSRNVKSAMPEAVENLSSVRKSRSVKESTTASTSSFSRSCLSKSPYSRGKSSTNGLKRSVRFYPVSVIVDEDSRPCGHKSICEDDPSIMQIPTISKISHAMKLKKELKNDFAAKENVASYNLKAYRDKIVNAFELTDFHDDNEEDDLESDSSSDLFELENIGAVGIGTYNEELPVYGTTDLKTSRAIANVF